MENSNYNHINIEKEIYNYWEKNNASEDLNYSFLAKLFSGLSDGQKEKILQVLRNTKDLEKTG